jgi:hypothetical protein
MSPLLLLSLSAVVLLVAAISDFDFHRIPDRFIYPTIILTTAHNVSPEGSKCFLISLGEIGIRISVLILPPSDRRNGGVNGKV